MTNETAHEKLPKTNCVLCKSKVIACDDYIVAKPDGTKVKDFTVCFGCGWNPEVSKARIERIRRERGA